MIATVFLSGHPRALVAALLCSALRTRQSSERHATDILRDTAAHTRVRVQYGMSPASVATCRAEAERLHEELTQMPAPDAVALAAVVVRELLVDAPECCEALDRRVRDLCERLYRATPAQRERGVEIAAEIAARVASRGAR